MRASERNLVDVAVGQQLVLRDVNENRGRKDGWEPAVGTVVKIGRTLVHVETSYGGVEKYRIDDGTSTSRAGFEWAQTREQYEDELTRKRIVDELRERGVTITTSHSLATRTLARVLGVIRQDGES